MPLYLYQIAYTPESLAAQMQNPQDRLEVVGKQLAESAGVKIVAGGYSFGEYDVAAIVEAADDTTMAAVAPAIAAGGAAKAAKTTPLLSGAQWVAALRRLPALPTVPYGSGLHTGCRGGLPPATLLDPRAATRSRKGRGVEHALPAHGEGCPPSRSSLTCS
jgi:uncharacterized protein with GYD domain